MKSMFNTIYQKKIKDAIKTKTAAKLINKKNMIFICVLNTPCDYEIN